MESNDIFEQADPDIILSAISKRNARRKGGRLYLFIGMAPGVGKTFSMLLAARELLKSKIDVVVGVVETHGRKDTENLLEGLSVIPKKKFIYRNIELLEMDLDAILKRKPNVVLVDELAHTNVVGSRHHKRWQDVYELLDSGINVYSTLNVQHLESRKESVEKIANINIDETVPDSVLDRAYQIKLVDLSVPELLKRLKEGKVYLGEKADIAAAHFFKEEKLTALRELSLRVAAERVDTELKTLLVNKNFFSLSERIMVCIGSSNSEHIIREARKIAYNLQVPWIALHISRGEIFDENEKKNLSKNLSLAHNLGAEVITNIDTDIVQAIIGISRQKNINLIIVGKSKKSLFKIFSSSICEQLIEKSGMDVWVIPTKNNEKKYKLSFYFNMYEYIKSLLCVVFLMIFNALLVSYVGYRSVGFVLLIGILLMGIFLPIGPILFASIITAIGWNFFFIPPTGRLHIHTNEDLFLSILYLIAAMTTGILTRRIKYQHELLVKRELRAQILNQILLDLGRINNLKDINNLVSHKIANFIGGKCDIILKKKDGELYFISSKNLSLENIDREMAVARWVIENNKSAGFGTETLSSAEAFYLPIKGTLNTMGALAFKSSKILSITEKEFLYTVSCQIALNLEKQQFRLLALSAEHLSESENMHRNMLKNLSCEIKNYQEGNWQRVKFAINDAQILSRIIAGIFPLAKEDCALISLIQEAVLITQQVLNKTLSVNIKNLSNKTIHLEKGLIIHALSHIFMNAVRHAPSSSIDIEIDKNMITITDHGQGVKESELNRIFDKYYKSNKSQGQGLGLYIAKMIIKAHNGKIRAKNIDNNGLMIIIHF